MLGILWFLFWLCAGILSARSVFFPLRRSLRVWLGVVWGLCAAIWAPIPFAFLFGFSKAAHLFAALALLAVTAVLVLRSRRCVPSGEQNRNDRQLLLFGLPLWVLMLILLRNHTLPGGAALYTGQCTYGDMCMHLGFITSIAEQGAFPPYYSILPSAQLCYPFLCDSVSSSLYLLGLPLRWAYMLPSAAALGLCVGGVWFLSQELAREKSSAPLALAFFFLNGGLGFLYFFNGDHSFYELFHGFYVTPTNLTESGIRWVNIICDMLIPQRATLFGWAILFSALTLLFRAVYRGDLSCALPAGILGGLLPMIHTHSFFALGLSALCWMVHSALRERLSRRWWSVWLRFGLTAVALAVPQLLLWTFRSVGGNEQFLRVSLDWVNGFSEPWLWFWVKNVGPLFLLTPVCFFLLPKEDRGIYTPIFFIFLLGEIVLFQPNPYDNNKIFYIAYLFAAIACADVLTRLGRESLLRRLALAVLLIVCCASAVLSLGRELISGTEGYYYQLFSEDEVRAAEFIREETAPDAVFLTSSNHDNAVAALTGRNIVCGSPSYLYYHGLDYIGAQSDAAAMLCEGERFEALREEYGVSYVYLSRAELALGADEEYFSTNYPLVFSSKNVKIFEIS